MRISFFILISVFIMSSCSSGSAKKSSNAKSSTPSATAISSQSMMLDNIQLTVPDGWTKAAPSSSMRVAQLNLMEDESVQISVFFFGEQDMAQANIERWKGQFTKVDAFENLDCKKPEAVAVKILGTFKKKARPMADDFTEAPNYGTLAAILPSQSGPYYIKLTARQNIINAQQSAFMKMIDTYVQN